MQHADQRAVWDLTQMAREVCSVLETTGNERAVEIDSAGAAEVTCDGALVRRVLENFVSNGIGYSPTGSLVRISIASGDGAVRVAVHDQGAGVAPEDREKIFEKFGTLEDRQESSYHSVGLGLAFCKRAIEAHGGTIGVDSGRRLAARSGSSCPRDYRAVRSPPSAHRRLTVDSRSPSPDILNTKADAPTSKARCLTSGSFIAVNTMTFISGCVCVI